MKNIFLIIILFAINNCFAEELVSIEDSRRILNTNKKAWIEQVEQAVSAKIAKKVYWQDELGISILVEGVILNVIPNYGASMDLPNYLSLNLSYSPESNVSRTPSTTADEICRKITNELKSNFSVLCGHSSKNGWRYFNIVTSIPGKYQIADKLNSSGNYSGDIDKLSKTIQKNSDNLLNKYWDDIEAWVINSEKNKSKDAEYAVKKIPEICSKIATIYSLQLGISPQENKDFSMDVDVCAKTTVHRKYPQPEFENPKIVKLICESKLQLYQEVCRRAKLK
jgi:hypothetical protein